jgi:hypothetical protein
MFGGWSRPECKVKTQIAPKFIFENSGRFAAQTGRDSERRDDWRKENLKEEQDNSRGRIYGGLRVEMPRNGE